MAKVFVTRRLPQPVLDFLSAAPEVAELRVNSHDRVLSRTELEDAVAWCDCLLCLLTDRIDDALLALNPKLRIVANYAVGYNNIDVAAATRHRIPVTNTPGVLTETTADLAWALLMAVARRVVESDVYMRSGKFDGWDPMLFLGADIHGKTLGVVGFGRIGHAVARRAAGFDMRILYAGPRRVDERIEKSVGAIYVDLDTLLEQSDFISLHPYLAPDTTHLIGEAELRRMKPTAYLINTSRGPVIDEVALVRALQEGWIAGAGLDVFEEEPVMKPGLAACPNAVIVPHIGSASVETRTEMGMIAARNILALLRGEPLLSCVNPDAC